ncbi:tRNA(fMet)-specific endonuclease VapC [bacterium HR15]|nr:tRNA(fMet)-specific endonuclease VapC [bacterium HR15]
MISALIDTHAFVWFLTDDPQLSSPAHAFIYDHWRQGNLLAVSAISIVEIVYLEEKGRIPSGFVSSVVTLFSEHWQFPFVLVPLDMSILQILPQIPRTSVPDMPDRIIVATAKALDVPLVTKDQNIHQSGLVPVIW